MGTFCCVTDAISGEFTSALLSRVFMELDSETKFNLSQARYCKDRTTWANSESWAEYQELAMVWSYFQMGFGPVCPMLVRNNTGPMALQN